MTQDQVDDLIKDIKSSGISLSPYSLGLLQSVETYGNCSQGQLDYIVNLHGVCCTMNNDWVYDKKPDLYYQAQTPAPDQNNPDPEVFCKGKYKGKHWTDIIVSDRSYLIWAISVNLVQVPAELKAILQGGR